MGNNPTAAIPEDATSGKKNIYKKFKVMNSDEKYSFLYFLIYRT